MPRIITPQDQEIERLRLACLDAEADEVRVNADAATRTANARAALNAELDARAATLGAQNQAFIDNFCLEPDEPVAPCRVAYVASPAAQLVAHLKTLL